jgi:hypothetical protein
MVQEIKFPVSFLSVRARSIPLSCHPATYRLARGLSENYTTSANMVWYTATRDQLQDVVIPLAASSPQAAVKAIAAMEVWLKEAPAEERQVVFACQYKLTAAEVSDRLTELSSLAR